MEDSLYKNKNAVRATLGIIKTMNKVQKQRQEEEEKFKPELETYKASTEYKQMVEELKKKDEDDEFKNDYDPKGYDLYEKAVSLYYFIFNFSLKILLKKLTSSQHWLCLKIQKIKSS